MSTRTIRTTHHDDRGHRAPRRLRLGAAAVTGTAVAAALALGGTAPAATAAGEDQGGDEDVSVELTERSAKELLDGRNHVRARGAAQVEVERGEIRLSFPIRDDRDRSERRDGTGPDGDGGDVARLRGGVAFTGAGPDVVWRGLAIDERGVVTAAVDGDRARVLRIADDDRRDRAQRGEDRADGDALRLTRAGARSLNRAAAGAPFGAGDRFAVPAYGDDDGSEHDDQR